MNFQACILCVLLGTVWSVKRTCHGSTYSDDCPSTPDSEKLDTSAPALATEYTASQKELDSLNKEVSKVGTMTTPTFKSKAQRY